MYGKAGHASVKLFQNCLIPMLRFPDKHHYQMPESESFPFGEFVPRNFTLTYKKNKIIDITDAKNIYFTFDI